MQTVLIFLKNQHQLVVQLKGTIFYQYSMIYVRKNILKYLKNFTFPWLSTKPYIIPDLKSKCLTFPWPWKNFIFPDLWQPCLRNLHHNQTMHINGKKKKLKMSKGVGYGTRAFYNNHMYALDKHAKHVLCSKKMKEPSALNMRT